MTALRNNAPRHMPAMRPAAPNRSRKFGLLLFLTGLLTVMVGHGMWRNPHLDWPEFLNSTQILLTGAVHEVQRLAGDPFAILGIGVTAGGAALAWYGARKLGRG